MSILDIFSLACQFGDASTIRLSAWNGVGNLTCDSTGLV